MATYNVHAGHCPQGQGASGAVGILQESVEDRIVKDEVIRLLRAEGHTVYDCTCGENTTKQGCLNKIVAKCNQHSVDGDYSIHLNSGRNDYHGDTKTGGVEVIIYDDSMKKVAERICANIAMELGIRNRGVKYDKGLFVLKKTKSPALLIECCFVDDADDAKAWNTKRCAKAIAEGILNKKLDVAEWVHNSTGWWYRRSDGSYPRNQFEAISGTWYYFDERGYMVTGWRNVNGKWYYFNESGAMQTGWQYVNGNWFYLKSSGEMIENDWLKKDGKWYWLKKGGYMARNEIVQIGNEYFAFLSDGHCATTNSRLALV